MLGARVLSDPEFALNVAVGWLILLAGVVVLLAAAVWWSAANPSPESETAPRGWRALCGLGWALFVLGWAWQLVGYVRIGIGDSIQ